MKSRIKTPLRKFAAWGIHAFTACGAILGLFSIDAIYHHEYMMAFWLMGLAIAIDAVDGTIARMLHVRSMTPSMDGALLDNLIDYLNYVFVPAVFLMISDLVPSFWQPIAAGTIILASAYQFCQSDAKTKDHFFKGFPSYWNITVFYLYFCQMSQVTNLLILFLLAALVFVPIKYVYPSRLNFLSKSRTIKTAMFSATLLWGVSTLALIWIYPAENRLLVGISLGYVIIYFLTSLYRTFNPLILIGKKKRGHMG